MVREATVRKRKYEAGIDAEALRRRIQRVKPIMVELESVYLAEIAEIERKIKRMCEAAGVSVVVLSQYINYGRQLYSICKKFSSVTLENEALNIADHWLNRGLNNTLLIQIATLFGITITALTLPPGFQELEDKLDALLSDIAIVHFESHSRTRVYPQDVTQAPTLAAAGAPNTFGPWAQIVPLNTVPFPFHVIGLCICAVSAATNYHIQLGYNTVLADPGANMEMGERRVRFATVPIAKQSELLTIYGQGVPANSRVMGRLKTASGNPDTATISVVLTRHLEVSEAKALYGAFPW